MYALPTHVSGIRNKEVTVEKRASLCGGAPRAGKTVDVLGSCVTGTVSQVDELVSWLVSWCFEPCQPLGVTSGLTGR